ncbi:hypothetical protein DV515_00007020, partial [Chloebia gouldiae]
MSYHHWENNSGHGGLEKPEQGQAEQLDDGEEVHPAQGHVAEIGKVWLVLGWHQEQPHTVHELQRRRELAHEQQYQNQRILMSQLCLQLPGEEVPVAL